MVQKTKISLNLTGLVLFDPVVLNEFVLYNNIKEDNLIDFFIKHPQVGNNAINHGVLLPVYSIEAWDYTIIVKTEEHNVVNTDWILFKTDLKFPLTVKSCNVIVSDIYSILNWKPDYYLNFPPKEDRVGVDDSFNVPEGNYAVQIEGFRDIKNTKINERECGYEFYFERVNSLPLLENINIDDFNFRVDGVSEGSY